MYKKPKTLLKKTLKQTAINLLQSEKYTKVNGSECAEHISTGTTGSRQPRHKQNYLADKIRQSLKKEAA